jgi:hypothetical protein
VNEIHGKIYRSLRDKPGQPLAELARGIGETTSRVRANLVTCKNEGFLVAESECGGLYVWRLYACRQKERRAKRTAVMWEAGYSRKQIAVAIFGESNAGGAAFKSVAVIVDELEKGKNGTS